MSRFGVFALLLLPVAAGAVPDLALPRAAVLLDEEHVEISVQNLGGSPSPATWLLLADGPLLGGPAGRGSTYRPVRGLPAVWVDHEAAADARDIEVTVHLTRGRYPLRSVGRLEVTSGVVTGADGGPAAWNLEVDRGGDSLAFVVRPAESGPAVLTVSLESEHVPISTSAGWFEEGSARIPLLAARRPARTWRVEVPALAAGSEVRVQAPVSGAAEIVAFVDPDDRIEEVREGNNVTSLRRDPAAPVLAALHVHSCLSEGPGSLDWQALHAGLAGYDLVWWSEHDWRVSCFEHLESFGFEEGEDVTVLMIGEESEEPAWELEDVLEGQRSLRLAPGGIVRLVGRRDRFAYSLASEVTVELAALVYGGPESSLVVAFELSRHPGEQRELVYELVSPDRAIGSGTRVEGGVAYVTVPVAPGSWKRVALRVSADAARAWPNGSDDNLLSIQLECSAEGNGALADAFVIRHERCGTALTDVQREWIASYPNLRHEIGGEISYRRPHLARYGGPDELVDLDAAWKSATMAGEAEAEVVIRRVQESGGIVSWCHPFGPSRHGKYRKMFGEQYWDTVLETGLGGADLLEVGYRERAGYVLADYLERWDLTSAAGIPVTGVGVNDSHHIQWGPGENDFATWIHAPTADAAGLRDALLAGHAFFGDPLAFRGVLRIRCGDAVGGDIVTGEGPREVRVRVTGAPEGVELRLIVDGKSAQVAPAEDGELVRELAPGAARWVRAEAWSADGRPLAFTNPIRFDPDGSLHRARR